jgi:hypothetical protein
LTIEWSAVCAALPALSVTQLNTGTTAGAPAYFDVAGQCSFANGGGAERAYAFTAPSDGTLHLELTQPSDNFSLYVQNGYGPIDPGTYVACSNFAQVGEVESPSPSLAAGQTVTVIVDGFTTADEGPYVLTATFEPG